MHREDLGLENRRLKAALSEQERERQHLRRSAEKSAARVLELEKILEAKERFAVLDQLVATVSHELRNPIGTISHSLFPLRAKFSGDPSVVTVLDRIERNTERCQRIVAELVDFARSQRLEPEPTDIDSWLRQVVEEIVVEIGVPEDISVASDFSSGAECAIDRERLRRVLVNLATNGIQAIGDGDAGRLDFACGVEGAELVIRVVDSGPGIAADEAEHCFEPLYSTKVNGVGLGLPIVKRITELHGGTIELKSASAGGTEAALRLPL